MSSYTPAQCRHLPATMSRSGMEQGWLPAWQLGDSVVQAVLRHLSPRALGWLHWLHGQSLCCFFLFPRCHTTRLQSAYLEGHFQRALLSAVTGSWTRWSSWVPSNSGCSMILPYVYMKVRKNVAMHKSVCIYICF